MTKHIDGYLPMKFSASGLEFHGLFLSTLITFFSETQKTQTPFHHHIIISGLIFNQEKSMERNSFCNNLRDHSIGNKATKDISSNNNNNNDQSNYKVKDSSWSGNNQGSGEDYLAGFSWPPRSYTCSFCKREFRSAQALGGHMNVHRRDRARLRQSPPLRDLHGQHPFLNLNLSPNHNPNFSSSSLISSSLSSTLPNSLLVSPPLSSLSSPSSDFPCEMKKWRLNSNFIDPLSSKGSDSTNMKGAKSLLGASEFKDYGRNNKFLKKKNEIVTLDLDLEIGLVSDSNEDLDLELRLGYS